MQMAQQASDCDRREGRLPESGFPPQTGLSSKERALLGNIRQKLDVALTAPPEPEQVIKTIETVLASRRAPADAPAAEPLVDGFLIALDGCSAAALRMALSRYLTGKTRLSAEWQCTATQFRCVVDEAQNNIKGLLRHAGNLLAARENPTKPELTEQQKIQQQRQRDEIVAEAKKKAAAWRQKTGGINRTKMNIKTSRAQAARRVAQDCENRRKAQQAVAE